MDWRDRDKCLGSLPLLGEESHGLASALPPAVEQVLCQAFAEHQAPVGKNVS